MANFEFKNLLVRSFSLDNLEVTWEIADTTLDPHNYDWHVERSGSPMGPWDPLAGPFSDRYRFVDNRVETLHRWRNIYYRIRSVEKVDTTNEVFSDAVTMHAPPDLIAEEIQLLERTVWNEFSGRECWIFPVRTFGQYCPACFDGTGKGQTRRRLRSNCLTCFDTNYARGYFHPIQTAVQIDPSPKSTQQLNTGQTEQSNTTARASNFPLFKPGDLIVETENRRWRVVAVSATERLRHVVHQELSLHEIVKGDMEFQLEINVGALRDLAPAGDRNFSRPQNLEAFESEADIQAILKSYGY